MLQEYQDHCQKDLLPVCPSLSTRGAQRLAHAPLPECG